MPIENLTMTDLESIHSKDNYWSTDYLRTYIDEHLESGGDLKDIFKLDIDGYKKSDSRTDRIPIKFKPFKGSTYRPFKLYLKEEKHTGSPYSEEYKNGSIKIAKYKNSKLFMMDGKEYKMRPDATPCKDDESNAFAVIGYMQTFVEDEFTALIEQGIIGLPKKKKDKGTNDCKIMLRNKNDDLNVPIRYKSKDGGEMVNPRALLKLQKEADTFRFSKPAIDISDGVDYEVVTKTVRGKKVEKKVYPPLVLNTNNIEETIPTKTEIDRAMVSLNAIQIYDAGVSIAAYVDGMKIKRPITQQNIEYSDNEDSEQDVAGVAAGSGNDEEIDFE